MNKKESICEKCAVIFTHKSDRSGKFCSQACHYASKRETAICSQCGKEFETRKKEPRKTCSDYCFMMSRGLKSKDPRFKDTCDTLKKDQLGQITLDETMIDKIRRTFFELFGAKSEDKQ